MVEDQSDESLEWHIRKVHELSNDNGRLREALRILQAENKKIHAISDAHREASDYALARVLGLGDKNLSIEQAQYAFEALCRKARALESVDD